MTYSNRQKLRRELAMRAHVYPQMIARGQMTLADAERHTDILLAIAVDYERKIDKDEPSLFPEANA